MNISRIKNSSIFVKALVFCLIVLVLFSKDKAYAVYKPEARLFLKNLNFCISKPLGFRKFSPVSEKGVSVGEDTYLYAEVENCKSKKDGRYYYLDLVMDMDIYYENGTCVYSQKDVKSFDTKSLRKLSKSFVWVKIETRYLKPGKYKIEIRLRDNNTDKVGFALQNLKLI